MLPGLWGKFASKKVIHLVLIAFCREVKVQCKEKLFQTPACKPSFHVKISNKKAATDVAAAINLLGTFFSACPLPINCHLLLPNQHCFQLAQSGLPSQNLFSQRISCTMSNTFLFFRFSFYMPNIFPFIPEIIALIKVSFLNEVMKCGIKLLPTNKH